MGAGGGTLGGVRGVRLRDELLRLVAAGDPVAWTWLDRLDRSQGEERRRLLTDLAERLERCSTELRELPRDTPALAVSRATAVARVDSVLAARVDVSVDAAPIDPDPDRCWRCDAAPGRGPAGLCAGCVTELR
jgi:hypothetical protein